MIKKERKWSKLAIVSFIISFLSVLGIFVVSFFILVGTEYLDKTMIWVYLVMYLMYGFVLLGVILSILSLVIIKKNNLKGKSIAIASLVISGILFLYNFIWIFISLALFAVFYFWIGRNWSEKKRWIVGIMVFVFSLIILYILRIFFYLRYG